MQAVIFDMDGVIVDSEQYWNEQQRAILVAVLPEDAAVTPEELTGLNVMDQYEFLQEQYDVTASKEEYFELYDEKAETVYHDRATLMDGFYDILDLLETRDVKRAIASASFRSWVDMVLDRFDLASRIDMVMTADEVDGDSKPSPDIYLQTAEQLNVAPADCVVVEDSGYGVTAAKHAEMYCIGFRTAHNPEQDLSAADTVVDSPDALYDALQSLAERNE